MKRAISRAISLPLITCLVASPLPLAAQAVELSGGVAQAQVLSTDNDAWGNLRQLAAGEDIRVSLPGATSYRGTFRIADGESITLVVDGHDQRVSRASIRRVLVARGTHRWRNVLLGLAIGAATAGLTVALHCRGEASSCKEVAPAYFYPLAGAGAGLGALLPAQHWQEIYVASLSHF